MPLPGLRYAPVVKTVRRRRVVHVCHRVVFGTFEAIQQVLAAVVYLYPAGNSVASKSGKIPPFHYLCEGALPWYHTCFSTS